MKYILLALLVGCQTPGALTPAQQRSAVQELEGVSAGSVWHCTVWHLTERVWVTAAHCVDDEGVFTIGGEAAVPVRYDPGLDLAVFMGPVGYPDLHLADQRPEFGAEVHYIGYPRYGRYSHLGVYRGHWAKCYVTSDDERHGLCEFSGFTDGGASGSPLLDAEGRVVGVVTFSYDGHPYSYAVPVDILRKFLAD